MAVVDIVIGADSPVLRAPTEKISAFDKDLASLVQDLVDTVKKAKGAGLAAPQVGISQAVTVARIGGSFVPLINPKIKWQSDTVETMEEGCLSIPETWLMVPRPSEIIIHFLDPKGKEQERKLQGFDARVAQHEIDHLNGKLIVDY